MGASRRPRASVWILSIVFHVLLLILLVMASRERHRLQAPDQWVSALILPPAVKPPIQSLASPPRESRVQKAPIAVKPQMLSSISTDISLHKPSVTAATTDWTAESERASVAVARQAAPSNDRPEATAGELPSVLSAKAAPSHHAGDQYQSNNGDWIVWVSDSCYQINTMAPGLSDVVVQPLIATTLCPGSADQSGRLVENLQHRLSRPVTPRP
jgi:hypothetical protein